MVAVAEELGALDGQRFGRYVLRHRIARGGMASVYLAQLSGAHGFERWVALKVVHPHLAEDRRFVQMFLDEARLASRIHHPNVCQVIDFGEEHESAYLVMEYLHGETLHAVVNRSLELGAPIWLPVRAIVDAARGLHAAHELSGLDGHPLGLVHRDVSPQNLLVLYDGPTKVMDFGVARARGRIADTSANEVKGKISYMSPEQLEQQPIDRRTDIWGLGVLLWETTVRRPLFRAENEGATALNVVRMNVPRPSTLVDSYSAMLEEVVMTALQRDPARRFGTAAELADALESYLYSVGRPTGHAQVAQWMGTAFARRREERDQILRVAHASYGPRADEEALIGSHGTVRSVQARSKVVARRRRRRTLRAGLIGALGMFVIGGAGAWVASWFIEDGGPGSAEVADAEGASEVGSASASATELPSGPARTSGGAGADTEAAAGTDTEAAAGADMEAAAGADTEAEAGAEAEPETAPRSEAVAEAEPETPTAGAETRAPADDEPETATSSRRTLAREDRRRATRRSPPRRTGQADEEEPAPAVVETGTLNLLAIPTAEVSLEGRALGRTPLVNRTLPAGQHVLTLTPLGGGASKRIVVRIRPGENTRASVSLSE